MKNHDEVEQELQRRYLQGDCSWDCPRCGTSTEELQGASMYEDNTHYNERSCPHCQLRLTVVYRMHYQYGQEEQEEFDAEGVSHAFNESALDDLRTVMISLSMCNFFLQGKHLGEVVLTLARKVDPAEWPRVLVGNDGEGMKNIAKHMMEAT